MIITTISYPYRRCSPQQVRPSDRRICRALTPPPGISALFHLKGRSPRLKIGPKARPRIASPCAPPRRLVRGQCGVCTHTVSRCDASETATRRTALFPARTARHRPPLVCIANRYGPICRLAFLAGRIWFVAMAATDEARSTEGTISSGTISSLTAAR
jgi:hypothetical protein